MESANPRVRGLLRRPGDLRGCANCPMEKTLARSSRATGFSL